MKDFEFDLEFIENLIDMAKDKDVKKIKLSIKDFSVFVDFTEPIVKTTSFGELKESAQLSNEQEVKGADQDLNLKDSSKLVVAPIIGTFYSSPAPDKDPFVEVGDRVKKGDVLFIIESMKLMNEVKSEFDGTVSKILVKSGDGVEYGQPIIILE